MVPNIIQLNSTVNTSYLQNRSIDFLVIHYTAGTTSRKGVARNIANWFSKPIVKASADFIVDDEEIVQFNPDIENRFCWSVGGKKYPRTKGGKYYGMARSVNCINIEICSNNKTGKITTANDNNWYFTEATLNNALVLTKYLMERFNIKKENLIRHFDVNGKPCPGVVGWNEDSGNADNWNEFKNKVIGEKDTQKVKIVYCGKKYEIEGKSSDGRNYVWIRELIEKVFGMSVEWNPATKETIILPKTE